MNKFKQTLIVNLIIIFGLSGIFFVGLAASKISILFLIIGIIIATVIFFENRHPAKTAAWIVTFTVFPFYGFICYFLFGRNYRKNNMFKKKIAIDSEHLPLLQSKCSQDEVDQFIQNTPKAYYRFFTLAQNITKTPLSVCSETKVLSNGEETFSEITEALEKAEDHIHLEYYVVRNDTIGKQIKNTLIEKAKSGVEVRFLYDTIGCWFLPKSYLKEMKAAGVKTAPFYSASHRIFSTKMNFTSHRKILVIDGKIGFVGGINIGDEYLGKHPYFGNWRDTHLKLIGDAVTVLQHTFLTDWYYNTGEPVVDDRYLVDNRREAGGDKIGAEMQSGSTDGNDNFGAVQIVSSGPEQRWSVMKKLYLSLITSAQKKIDIASPYFVPDQTIINALKVASNAGVEVTIIVPKLRDKRAVYYAMFSYFQELLDAGVNIYFYKNGFIHAKAIIVDDIIASVGSTNMNMRSFHYDFEINAFLYNNASVEKLVADFQEDLLHSERLVAEIHEKRNLIHRSLEATSRLLSPLM